MDTRKLENIIIVILSLLNLFLLLVVFSDDVEARNSRQETIETITALLQENGIAVGADAELLQDAPAPCTVARDLDLEQSRMKNMLGSCYSEDQGGSIWFYRSDAGQAVIRGTGEVDMLLTGDTAATKGNPKKAAIRLLSRAGITLDADSAAVDESGGHMELCCCWNGYPVYNAVMAFEFSESSLYLASGTLVFNAKAGTASERGMDSVSVLMRFLEIVRNEGFICSRLECLTPGYLMTVAVSGESTLTPVWCIQTDTGSLYINALSGATV